jgi:hypothetical protein
VTLLKKALDTVLTVGVLAGCVAMHEYKASADSVAYLDPDDNAATMQQFVDAVGVLERKYGTGDIVVATGFIGGYSAYASANANGITVNKFTSTQSPEEIAGRLADDVALGYHRGGCTGPTLIAVHETAHVIDARRGWIGSERLAANAAYMTGTIAGYSFHEDGSLNPAEAVAEAFQAVECGTANATDFQIYEMLVS